MVESIFYALEQWELLAAVVVIRRRQAFVVCTQEVPCFSEIVVPEDLGPVSIARNEFSGQVKSIRTH